MSNAPSPWVVKYAGLSPPGSSVLDVACGRGRHVRYFLEQGYRVTAIDKDTSRLADINDPNLEVSETDLEVGEPWPLGDRVFDLVLVTNYLHRPLFPDLLKSVKSGGMLIYETFMVGNEKYGKPSNPNFLLNPGELKEIVEGQFEVHAFHEGSVEQPSPAMKQMICAIKNS